MRPYLRALLATTVIALAMAAPSGAILNGNPDTTHPYVGILVTVVDGQRVPVCSGFLVSSTVFVTAAHCVDWLGAKPAYVSFNQAFTASSSLRPGTAVPNPAFGAPEANTHDIALVVLNAPASDGPFATLPSRGLLDSSAKKDALTVVGYGTTSYPKVDFRLVRTFGDARISKLEKGGFNFRMSSGICYGDSGGPVLLGTSDIAVGINSFVNGKGCAGNAYAFRTDTTEAQNFLAGYL